MAATFGKIDLSIRFLETTKETNNNKMKLKALLIATIGATAINASAGDYAASSKEVVVPEIAVEEPLGATISAGYMTDYIFYGLALGEHAPWFGVDYSIEGLPIPVDVGVWYINPTEPGGPTDELDLYVSTGGSIGAVDYWVAFTGFFFPEVGGGETYELATGGSVALFGPLSGYGEAHYDFTIEGWYFEGGLEAGFDITDTVGLSLSAGVGYEIDYYTAGDGFSNVSLTASLPIALRSNVTLEPYIGYLIALDQLDAIQEDLLHGGVSLSVSF